MQNKNNNYPEALVTHLVLRADKSQKQMKINLESRRPKNTRTEIINRQENGKFIMRIPSLRTILFGKKKLRYIIPKGGIPIIAGPAVINRLTAMTRVRKFSHFSI